MIPAAATVSLRDICDVCGPHLVAWTDAILTHCLTILADTAAFTIKDRLRTIEALGKLISANPIDTVMSKVQQLLTSCITNIQSFVLTELRKHLK